MFLSLRGINYIFPVGLIFHSISGSHGNVKYTTDLSLREEVEREAALLCCKCKE